MGKGGGAATSGEGGVSDPTNPIFRELAGKIGPSLGDAILGVIKGGMPPTSNVFDPFIRNYSQVGSPAVAPGTASPTTGAIKPLYTVLTEKGKPLNPTPQAQQLLSPAPATQFQSGASYWGSPYSAPAGWEIGPNSTIGVGGTSPFAGLASSPKGGGGGNSPATNGFTSVPAPLTPENTYNPENYAKTGDVLPYVQTAPQTSTPYTYSRDTQTYIPSTNGTGMNLPLAGNTSQRYVLNPMTGQYILNPTFIPTGSGR